MLRHPRRRAVALTASLLLCGAAQAQIRIAFIDPLSGFLGAVGQHGLRELQFAAERINAEGGANGKLLEVVPFDNKVSPQESLVQLNRAIDMGIRYVMEGNSSAVAATLLDAIAKHNARFPDKALLFLNYAAVDPDLTNARCNFWHFRFDATSDMKLDALVRVMESDKSIRKLFIIGQDYSFGHQVARSARELLKKRRPDVQIVGEELHPIARVKDFAPYVAKIKAAAADTVISGNWGADLALLIKAARDAGLKANFYTLYAHAIGAPTALGETGVEHVRNVSVYSPNVAPPQTLKYIEDYKRKNGPYDDPYTIAGATALQMLAKAMNQSRSADPRKVAFALEGMRHDGFFGEVQMRATDHQQLQPLFVDSFARVDGKKVKVGADGTPLFGFRNERRVEAVNTALPTSCVMERPAH